VGGTWNTAFLDGTCCRGALLLKLDASGNVQWQKAYHSGVKCFSGGTGKTSCTAVGPVVRSLHATADGGYVLAGDTQHASTSGAPLSPWLGKVDANGNLLWQYVYYESGSTQYFASADLASNGGHLPSGSHRTTPISEASSSPSRRTARVSSEAARTSIPRLPSRSSIRRSPPSHPGSPFRQPPRRKPAPRARRSPRRSASRAARAEVALLSAHFRSGIDVEHPAHARVEGLARRKRPRAPATARRAGPSRSAARRLGTTTEVDCLACRQVAYWREAPGFGAALHRHVGDDGDTISGLSHLSRDGSTWKRASKSRTGGSRSDE
jgi:hypothetical protein